MKKYPLTILFAVFAAAPVAFAGQEITETKDVKQTVIEEPLFKDHELQFGDYAVYSVGNGPAHVGLFRNHAWGDGNEVNYFFTRYLGIGAEYMGTYAQESPDTDRGRLHNHQVDLEHVGGNFFFRWPIESLHLAPYAYVGGGADFGDRKWGEAYSGLGCEYRIIQHWLPKIVAERIGFFVDARWTYLGDRYFPDDNESRGNLNYFTTRRDFASPTDKRDAADELDWTAAVKNNVGKCEVRRVSKLSVAHAPLAKVATGLSRRKQRALRPARPFSLLFNSLSVAFMASANATGGWEKSEMGVKPIESSQRAERQAISKQLRRRLD